MPAIKKLACLRYGIQTQYRNDKLATDDGRRINGKIALRVPKDVVKQKTGNYEQGGKPVPRSPLASSTDYTILNTYHPRDTQRDYRRVCKEERNVPP
jgi:hypothetical protein